VIDLFRTWLPQIVGYAEMLRDGTLERAWAEGDRSITSVYYSGELSEQVFGDHHADTMLVEARRSLGAQPAVVKALDGFLLALKRLDDWIEVHVDTTEWGKAQIIPASVRDIFDAQEWWDANSAADALVTAAGEAGFRQADWDPTQTLH
jgi:hypothetical protein